MHCESYLEIKDREIFDTQVLEVIRSSDEAVMIAKLLVSTAKECGLFENIKIGHEQMNYS